MGVMVAKSIKMV